MHLISRRLLVVPALALASACAGEPESAISADLQKDLELATATSLELASSQRTQVVSALESAPTGRTAEGERVQQPTPRRNAPRAVAPVRLRSTSAEAPAPAAEVAADPEPVEAPVAEMAPAAGDVATEEAGVEETVQAGGPVVTSDGVGTGRPRDPGGWGGPLPGEGVVIRGGGVGEPDHCQIHRPGRGPVVVGGYPPIYGPVYGGGRVPRGGYPSAGTGRARTGGSTARPRGPSPSSMPAPATSGGRTRARN